MLLIKSKLSFLFISFLLFLSVFSSAQKQYEIKWYQPIEEVKSDGSTIRKIYFENVFYPHADSILPYLVFTEAYPNLLQSSEVNVSNIIYQDISAEEQKLLGSATIPNQFNFSHKVLSSGKNGFVQVKSCPFVQINGRIQKVKSFDYQIVVANQLNENKKSARLKAEKTSPLSVGTWYKIGVVGTGIYKMDKNFLSGIGIDVSGLNPKNIRIFGNSTGMLPEVFDGKIPNTLSEAAIYVEGENDGVFNDNDYVLFYAKGPHTWKYNSSDDFYEQNYNLYADTAYYFINVDQTAGKRIQVQSSSSNTATISVTDFDDYATHQVDKYNLIQSGRRWMGEYFDITTSYDFSFSFPNINTSKKIKIKSDVAVRSFLIAGNNLNFYANGNNFKSYTSISSVSSHYTAMYVQEINLFDSTSVSSENVTIGITYQKPQSSSVAWLDYITLNANRKLQFTLGQLAFRNARTVGVGNVSQFNLSSSSSSVAIWDVTNPLEVKSQALNYVSGVSSFTIETDSLKEFVSFDGSLFYTPIAIQKINNQNILAYVNKDYILVCPAAFYSEAKGLTDFHESFSGYKTAIVTTEQIYNEFSSGAQDITAIRNFLRYVYENSASTPLKYVMLMGDGSYDYKNYLTNNTNFVPSFQSDDSFQPLSSFTSDDFFAMLDDDYDIYNSNATVDIGIGRFPAMSTTDVANYVAKVKAYANSSVQQTIENSTLVPYIKGTYGDWKNSMVFVADDGNSDDSYTNAHMLQTEMIIESVEEIDSTYNFKKVYLDLYSKVSSPQGGIYPDVDREIELAMSKGTFMMSYIGHGGEAGWADEKILDLTDIQNWTNINKLPLFLTATCEFSRYDNPERTSAGEYVILNPNGGSIALLTTVRLVFGGLSNNIGFSINYIKSLLPGSSATINTIGEATRLSKILSPMGSNYNNRKFSLLGDPGISLTHPIYRVETLSITDENGIEVDTIKALSKVKISGQVKDRLGNVASSYNGVLYPTVYDKFNYAYTLDNNDKGHLDSFLIQKNILFKGKASVKNGLFSFEFMVPKDINYVYGDGKISYYVANQSADGSDYFDKFKIGGSATNYVADNSSPIVELYMNDSNFVSGGLTNESPSLLAMVYDESGINTVGTSIGHDLVAILDKDYDHPYVLNEYYEANMDDYTSGKIKYPFSNLTPGPHNLKLKVWDIQNNSSEASLDFVVSNSSILSITHILNYPNPFTTNTSFYFEHNQSGEAVDVKIKIYTISGKIVKNLDATLTGSGSAKGNAISWDGKDDFGDQLARGVYFYKLEVKTESGLTAEKIEKLVIL